MKKAIGIDLGTTNSVVAFKDTAVKIIRNKENEELTRSCVGLRKGELLVGRNAYQLLTADPINTILSVKRLMGGAIKDKMVQDMIHSPYYKFGITSLKSGTDDAVAVVLGGKQYTPEQISAEILKKLKEDAEEKLGDEVTHAVITVPAYFTEKQKNATLRAAEIAGLKVQQLLAEPTAAAISYGIDNMKAGDSTSVLIYDFGGGTFDLSILTIVDGRYIEGGKGGDRWLGGDDIDKALQEFILKKFESTNNSNIKNVKQLVENLSQKKKWNFEGLLRMKTEEKKIELSSSKTANIFIDNLLEDENGDSVDIDIDLTREEFESIAKPFIERSIELIGTLFKEVGYDISMIDKILLVGGTSCIPLVKQMLSEKFGAGKIKVSEKPMLAIAEGAAILSNRLDDNYIKPTEEEPQLEEILHCTSHKYFVALKDGEFGEIINRQESLPHNVSRAFKTTMNNQKIVKVAIHSDIEDGIIKPTPETTGFFTLEDDLPLGSDIVLDITLGIDEVFNIKAYPKNHKSKSKHIVLGRGNKDSRALDFLSSCLEKMMGNGFSEKQRDFFFKSAKKEIEKINSFGTENSDSEKWEEVGTNAFSAFEQAERITDTVDEDELAIIFAAILLNEYPDLIGSETSTTMKRLISETKNEDDPLLKIQAMQKLKTLTDEYPVLITLFTVKMASDKAVKSNPTDGHRLLQMHDQIVNHFRNRRKDEAFALLDEAIELRDKYDQGGTDLGSIHLGKGI